MIENPQNALELFVSNATKPFNGQLPRPWMTDLKEPLKANVFIVGRNQRNGYDSSVLSHERHVDALFNRNGASCRDLYNEMTNGKRSPTRKNTDLFRSILAEIGVTEILETNVICYSTPMSADLTLAAHKGGTKLGTEIFSQIYNIIKPQVIVVHGTGARKDLGKELGVSLPLPSIEGGTPSFMKVGQTKVITIPSLAPPQWNKWKAWSNEHLHDVSKLIAQTLNKQ